MAYTTSQLKELIKELLYQFYCTIEKNTQPTISEQMRIREIMQILIEKGVLDQEGNPVMLEQLENPSAEQVELIELVQYYTEEAIEFM